ncbi:uncharacterized protein LOC122327103 isoform X2 [Puntigrus tetrazona]|uniref:uncharacterized protein LOC122327103 isoform X2 n=1 Tax=Puntigrus tetrazona TaxID=1606681 RepID=UPI001C891B49|nr:uncharacterized protein LOC122327103 isoform X2 [Puntigrus tetrazona]
MKLDLSSKLVFFFLFRLFCSEGWLLLKSHSVLNLGMDRLCGIILILLLTEEALQEEQMNVRLEPKHIKVCERASVTINCTFESDEYVKKVSWHYSQTSVLNCGSANKIPEDKRFIREKSKDWSALNITFIRTNDSGWYFCKITQDIPVLIQRCSNPTQVIVDTPSPSPIPSPSTRTRTRTRTTEPQNQTLNLTTDLPTTCGTNATEMSTQSSFPEWCIWLAPAIGCVVLLLSIVVIFLLTRKPKEIIYENTKPAESSCWRRNRAKMDICDLPASKKTETIKPLRKYDTLSSNRIRRP